MKCDGKFFVMFYVPNGKWNAALCESKVAAVISTPFYWFFFIMGMCDVGSLFSCILYTYFHKRIFNGTFFSPIFFSLLLILRSSCCCLILSLQTWQCTCVCRLFTPLHWKIDIKICWKAYPHQMNRKKIHFLSMRPWCVCKVCRHMYDNYLKGSYFHSGWTLWPIKKHDYFILRV